MRACQPVSDSSVSSKPALIGPYPKPASILLPLVTLESTPRSNAFLSLVMFSSAVFFPYSLVMPTVYVIVCASVAVVPVQYPVALPYPVKLLLMRRLLVSVIGLVLVWHLATFLANLSVSF